MKNLVAAAIGVISMLVVALSATAREDVVLTVTKGGNMPAERSFTATEFAELPQQTIETANEFVDGVNSFNGPLVRDVLELLGKPAGEMVKMTAVNDYQVVIPLEELLTYDVILATHMNGVPLSRRDKGPIWVIYPMSDNPELRSAEFNSKLIWQLSQVEFE